MIKILKLSSEIKQKIQPFLYRSPASMAAFRLRSSCSNASKLPHLSRALTDKSKY